MKERTAAVGASLLGLGAVGGLFLFSRHRDSSALDPKVTGISVSPATSQSPALVEIAIEPSPALQRLVKEGSSCEYRVVDEGRMLPMLQSADESARRLRVIYGYEQLPRPQLEVWIDGVRQASIPLLSMPPPQVTSFVIQPEAQIRAFHLPTAENERLVEENWSGRGGIRFAPRNPLPSDERWQVTLLETPAQHPVWSRADEGQALLDEKSRAGGLMGSERNAEIARLFYAEDTTAVRVRVKRWRRKTRSWRVILSGLRLVKKNNQTVLDLGGTKLVNAPDFSLKIDPKDLAGGVSPAGAAAPGGVDADGDRRSPATRLMIDKEKRSLKFLIHTLPPPKVGGGAMSGPTFISYEQAYPKVKIVNGADLERLNIRRLDLWIASWSASHAISGPVDQKPFDVALDIDLNWDQDLGSFEATIPVQSPNP